MNMKNTYNRIFVEVEDIFEYRILFLFIGNSSEEIVSTTGNATRASEEGREFRTFIASYSCSVLSSRAPLKLNSQDAFANLFLFE